MTDSAIDRAEGSQPPRDRTTPILFAVAIFTSAALVFVVQPMVARLVLPMLGGSPSVWNTSMVFFQTALLAGYGYAHALQRVRSLRLQLLVHLCLLLAAALFLPLTISGVLGDPDPSAPIGWLLATLALSVGAPFAVLSATAPLLQAWYGRVRAGYPDGRNPYVLYAASNLGSVLALLAYPVVIEPLMSLSGQRAGWTGGYAVFLLMIVALALVIGRRRPDAAPEPAPLPVSPVIPWRDKAVLVLLAAAPSSLMLGVTAHLSTDVASAPFLWVAPLALYLLTFVIAFQTRPLIPPRITLLIQAGLVAATVSMVAMRTGEWIVMFGLHLATFFFTALMCHQLLAGRRPAPDRLTEFYLLLSLGGLVGGVFNALVAPTLFNLVWEYPLVLVLVGLARPWGGWRPPRSALAVFALGLLVAAAPPIALEIMRYNPGFRAMFSDQGMIQTAQFVLLLTAIVAFFVRDRALMFTLALAGITVSSHYITRGYDWSLTERSFFGVMRVANIQEPRLGGDVHVLMHGTTLHGAQARDPAFACTSTLYYAPPTPIGQATRIVQLRAWDTNIGVVGQGSGAMAAFKREEDSMTFFEIDPMVDRMSRDPAWYTFINGCADGPVRTVLGDARLTLDKEPAGTFDLLVVDAFSSDAVPTHLLTREAIAGYLRVMKPNGVVVLHLSNRNLDIARPAESAARALGVPHLTQLYLGDRQAPNMAEASTEALVLSPTEEGLAEFREDARWQVPEPTPVRPWTDDYVDLFGALWRNLSNR